MKFYPCSVGFEDPIVVFINFNCIAVVLYFSCPLSGIVEGLTVKTYSIQHSFTLVEWSSSLYLRNALLQV